MDLLEAVRDQGENDGLMKWARKVGVIRSQIPKPIDVRVF
jgi:hypothetical protein